MVNIYLYGIKGTYNYGCEAMVRSISECLRRSSIDCNVIYESYSFENDLNSLCDCNSVSIGKIVKYPFVVRVIRYLKRKLGIASSKDFIRCDYKWARECDLLIIIGGDVLDLSWSQRNQKIYDNERIYLSEIVKKYGGKIALWGISVGDFDYNISAKKKLLSFFSNTVDCAIIRDKKSFDYLKKNGVKNIHLYSDPAFIQRTMQTQTGKKSILGINLSPLSNRYLNGYKSDKDWPVRWANYITNLFNNLDYKGIYLIPHVVNSKFQYDDDYAYLNKICELLRNNGVPVTLLPANSGFLKIKQYLCECDLILAARMHCAINAITCGVPTIFLSYSPKSFGMCNNVYGDYSMVLDLNTLLNNPQYSYIKEISNKTDEIRAFLSKKNKELCDDASKAVNEIVSLYTN